MIMNREYDYIEFARYAFETEVESQSYFCYERPTVSDNWSYEECFHCGHCDYKYAIKDLTFKNQTVQCKCGEVTSLSDLRPYRMTHDYHSNREVDTIIHNVNNGTLNKFNVPTIIDNNEFYCPECHGIKNIYSYKKEDGYLYCDCGASYTFDECKLQYYKGSMTASAGDIYFDEDKISISIIKGFADVNRFSKYYWSTGTTRATMNLKTGYSYQSNTGCCYNDFNRAWKRYHGNDSNAPKMFNATYNTFAWEQLNDLCSLKMRQLQVKYVNHPNLVRFIQKNKYKLSNIIRYNLTKQIDDYMTNYYNTKLGLSYRIKSFKEIVNLDPSTVTFNEKYTYEILHMLVLHNRFINADYANLTKTLPRIFDFLKFNKISNKYKKLNRETNQPVYDICSAFTKVSKSLRKRITNDIINSLEPLYYDDIFFTFLLVANYFKNKENVNKLYNLMISKKRYYNIYHSKDGLELWFKFRDEKYISNIKTIEEFSEKLRHMRDSIYTIQRIKKVYGDDWSEDSVKFHNEKQFHDDLVAITNSQHFRELQDAQRKAELSEPFKMEDEVFKLQNKDITIALNEYELSKIGSEMHICVGGYGNDVRYHGCRIAYIKHEDRYIACLELRVNFSKKETTYTLHQAKLKYNELVGTNEKYYKIVSDWCESNNIKIITDDMRQRFNNNQKQIVEGGF